MALFPARMREISSPRLNAWLKRSRDWKVETNGNHDNNAIGEKMITPIPASYIRANSLTESHIPRLQITFFHVIASCQNIAESIRKLQIKQKIATSSLITIAYTIEISIMNSRDIWPKFPLEIF